MQTRFNFLFFSDILELAGKEGQYERKNSIRYEINRQIAPRTLSGCN